MPPPLPEATNYGRAVQVLLVVAVFALVAGLVFLPFSDDIRHAWQDAGADDATLDLLTAGVSVALVLVLGCVAAGIVLGVLDVIRGRNRG